MKLYKSTYKDVECIVLENDKLRATFLPRWGGKMASLIDKSTSRELLWQNENTKYIASEYDTLFEAGDMSGFDEMFPTISECFYPSGPWRGIKVPDHGEVWAIPWEYSMEDAILHMWVHGVKFPYKLEKWIKIQPDNVIRTDYKVTNLCVFDFDFIWAAHPLFNVNDNTQIVLPKSVKNIINVYGGSKRLGRHGKIHPWPVTSNEKGEIYHINRIYPNEQKHCEKFYVLNELSEGWCALHDTKTNDVIGMSFPIEKVPYLGIWINEGGYVINQYNAAPEPCTGAYDRVDIAKQWGCVKSVAGRQSYEWYLNITVDNVKSINAIDACGKIE